VSTLHERLLAAIAPPAGTPFSDLDPNAWLAALRVVVELHAPKVHFEEDDSPRCGCGQDGYMAQDGAPWPCSTIQAIARELGVDGGE
jgi:hypothetical protein